MSVRLRASAFGGRAWNKGKTKADQSGLEDFEKRCSTCLVVKLKSEEDYFHHPRTPDGYAARCKECTQELRKPPDKEQRALNRQRRNNYKKKILREYELMLEIEEMRSQPARIQMEGIT